MTRLALQTGSIRSVAMQNVRANASTASASAPKYGVRALGSEAFGALLLSAVAGYVDTAGFLALFGLFTAHITGDLVTAGTTVGEQLKLGSLTRLAMIPIFVLSVAATTLFARAMRRSGNSTLTPMLALMTAALALFCITGVTLSPLAIQPDSWAVVAIGGAGVVAMGIQNTLMRQALSGYSPTTIMTGNLTQCTIDLVEFAVPAADANTESRVLARSAAALRLRKFGCPVLGFLIGVFFGGSLTHWMGLASIAVPTLAVGALAFESWGQSTKGQDGPRSTGWAKPRLVGPLHQCSHVQDNCSNTSRGRHYSMIRIALRSLDSRETLAQASETTAARLFTTGSRRT